jgi:(p)ppGpp synthase/HD superfamily hydrolase
MIYTERFRKAIRFAIKTHEVYQKQKRKGKDVAYIAHPLTVGLILLKAGASEDVVIAGILHDTIEDSVPEKKVTRTMVAERFGEKVAELVMYVTEKDKSVPWEERKRAALAEIDSFPPEAVLLKSADVIANINELLEDYDVEGDIVFTRFGAPKEKLIGHTLKVIEKLLEKQPHNPLAEDLVQLARRFKTFQ